MAVDGVAEEKMRRGKHIFKRNAFIILFIGIFLLYGCGQNEDPLTQTTDSNANEEIDTNVTEMEDNTEDNENNEPSEGLLKPLEVPANTQAEDIPYLNEEGIDLLRAVHSCRSDGENIYLAYNEPDLYIMPIGTDKHFPANIDNPTGLKVCSVSVDICGRIHLLMADQDYDEWYIWRLGEDYQTDRIIDISAFCETKRTPLWFLIDKDGTYFFQWPIDRNGIIVDSEGVLKHRFTPESLGIRWIYEAAIGMDGRIYLVYGSNAEEKREVGELDVESCSVKKEESSLFLPDNETFTAVAGGTDTNLLLFSPYSGVWAYDDEQGIMENRVPLSDIGFDAVAEFWPLTFLADGRLLLAGKPVNSKHTYEVALKYIPAGK